MQKQQVDLVTLLGHPVFDEQIVLSLSLCDFSWERGKANHLYQKLVLLLLNLS